MLVRFWACQHAPLLRPRLVSQDRPLPRAGLPRSQVLALGLTPTTTVGGGGGPAKVTPLYDSFVQDFWVRLLGQVLGAHLCVYLLRSVELRYSRIEATLLLLFQQRIRALTSSREVQPRNAATHPWGYGARILYAAVALRDATMLARWLDTRMRCVSMFAHKRYFRHLGVLLKEAVMLPFGAYRLAGFSLYLVGKISVTGNAMSRSYSSFAGRRGLANLGLRASSGFTIIRTKTGCLGCTLTFFF
jgi:hypothetical protein